MKKLKGYMAGANLGHWISQYGSQGKEHFDTYITEPDISRMASWGMDHVRVPVDYFIFEKDENPGVFLEEGLSYIDNCLLWCKKNGLNMILDLHHAPGFFFGLSDGEKTLFTRAEVQERYLNIWRYFAKRYINEGSGLIFELLNELVWKDSDAWNSLWKRAVKAIHEINPCRKIIIGSNWYNSVNELKNLQFEQGENLVYTFHMYEPFLFTHQKAPWVAENKDYLAEVLYPLEAKKHLEYYKNGIPELLQKHEIASIEYIKDFLSPAAEFLKAHDSVLYCGEYGVFLKADIESNIRWHEDVAEVLLSLGIGRAVWSYRGFNKITDENNDAGDMRLIRAVSRR